MWQVWLNPGSCLRGCKFLIFLYLPSLFPLPFSFSSIGMGKISTGTMSQTFPTFSLKATLKFLVILGKNLGPCPWNEKSGSSGSMSGEVKNLTKYLSRNLSYIRIWLLSLKAKSKCLVSGYFSNNACVCLSQWARTLVTSKWEQNQIS